ncbi:PHP domain-containing protein [Flavonifractor plautii]|uniref:PHP domain-containing protein n=1 Tax=Flavonifractor plautii TaxID=292800 RepID=UPI0018AAE723|nr:PHP domain-containing protein [Flavonifractor plautii]
MGSYIMYHCHSDYSLLDSCTKFQEYVDLALKNGQRAIASTEHGKPLGWISKKMYCDSVGIRFIHGVEIYLTESLEEKIRDNYHTVLLARNWDGVLELNKLVSRSCDKEHFYYTNRISFDEFLSISDNILSTSACLASPLNKLPQNHPRYMELARKYNFLEIQPHNHPEQIAFNQRLFELSQELGTKLIAGTDTHSSSKYKAECRAILLSAKHKNYGDEDAFDLSYKTYDELVEMFKAQNALPEDVYMDAINNTNLLYDLTEDFELDKSIKYPILYGSREADSEKFTETVESKFAEKLESGVIPKEQEIAFRDAIDEEMRVFRKLKMDGFMLSMSELISWCKEQGMAIGTARGSVGGSRVAYVTDIIDLNPETWHTVFSRFCNEDRVEIGDIDIDCVESDRPTIFQYIISRFGTDRTARVASFGTIQSKGVIDDVGRHLAMQWNESHDDPERNPWSLKRIAAIKNEFDADPERTKEKYSELFYYYDGLIDTKVSQSVHPAGMVISPISLDDNYGVFDKENENCLMLDMEEAHEVGVAKYDFLILKTVQVIRDACVYLGKPYPKTHEIDWFDEAVWADMIKSPSGIFQFESAFAFDSLKKFVPRSIFDMSLVTACIRPSGSSYRDALLAHKPHSNPSAIIDDLLKDNLGYLIYQEDTIKFLQQICGLSGSESDNIRRAIGRKQRDRLEAALPSILEGYCSKSSQPREVAEQEAKEFLQIIEDSASYQFGYNHSIAYCLLGYLCAYYRYYHPLEFLTSFLNNAANDDDIKNGTSYAEKIGIKITMPKWGYSKGEYFFNKEKNVIAKGLSSIKYMGAGIAEELYNLANSKRYERFVDVLLDIDENTSLNTRQLDILIKIDFFSDFGNQRELMKINELFNTFKKGTAKQIKKAVVDGTPLEPIVQKYAVGVTKSGGEAKSYTLLDVMSILRDVEAYIKGMGIEDISDIVKVRNFYDVMGYIGYVSGKDSDRRKLYVTKIMPVSRKSDGKQFGYGVFTKSIGSGVESRFTVFNSVYNREPIKEGDIIYCKDYVREGKYFKMTAYERVF